VRISSLALPASLILTVSLVAGGLLLASCGTGQGMLSSESLHPATSFRIVTQRTLPASSYDVLYRFTGGSDGAYPSSGLVRVNRTFYGSTGSGGTYNYGTIYSLSKANAHKVLYSFGGGSDGSTPGA
jgi:uncharacterized repeat protein (TIGR03803 family)